MSVLRYIQQMRLGRWTTERSMWVIVIRFMEVGVLMYLIFQGMSDKLIGKYTKMQRRILQEKPSAITLILRAL